MANLKKRFNEILEELDKNIKNKEDLEYIKTKVYSISMLFLDEVDKLTELSLDRLNVMIDREKELARKIAKMEKIISNLEKEVFVAPEGDFEIICPYCNAEFIEDLTGGIEHEVKCPECGNVIELDWHEDDECCGHHCGGECECDNCESDEEMNEDESDEDNSDEDDM